MARIAFVLPDLSGGGAERVALTLIEAFLAEGHHVDLVLAQAVGELLPLVPTRARVIDLRAGRLRQSLRPLAVYLRDQRPDAIQASMWPMTVIALLARRLSRSPARLIVSDHGILSKQYAPSRAQSALLNWTTRLFYPAADGRVCVSEECADDLARLSRLPRSDFTVIPNPIALPGDPTAPDAAVEAMWPPGKRVLAVGNLIAVKNHRLLIEAVAEANRTTAMSLLILGEGDLRASLEERARALGLGDRLVMPGFAIDPWPFYASADVFALSSDHEAYPGVLVEALTAGLPVVSTDCGGGPRQILADGKYGTLTPVGDPPALAAALLNAVESKTDTQSLRSRAEELAGRASIDRYRELLIG